MQEAQLRSSVHLDFHTSETIKSIRSDFIPEHFAETLAKANVDSVTCFARCHHGWLYFDSKAFPETKAPSPPKGLTSRADRGLPPGGIGCRFTLRSSGIITLQTRHPEWVAQDAEGRAIGTPPFEAGFMNSMRKHPLP